MNPLTDNEARQICEILDRRAQDIASFKFDLREKTTTKFESLPGSVELALTREVDRLRRLSDRIRPPSPSEPDDE